MKLYEIADEYRSLLEMIESGEIPEEAIADTLEAVGGELDTKLDGVIGYIKELNAEAVAIKAEADKLAARAKAKTRKAEGLALYITKVLEGLGRASFENEHHKISFIRSTAVRITDEAAFIEWARENAPEAIKIAESAKKSVIGDLIKSREIPFCEMEERKNIQIN
jgi:hypothetical protein